MVFFFRCLVKPLCALPLDSGLPNMLGKGCLVVLERLLEKL
jgi:hypothetical protein